MGSPHAGAAVHATTAATKTENRTTTPIWTFEAIGSSQKQVSAAFRDRAAAEEPPGNGNSESERGV
jgi:hypothetical protein